MTDTNVKTTAAQRKLAAELASYSETYRRGPVSVLRNHADERHIVLDDTKQKIVKRFRDGELSWNDAERWARDYYYNNSDAFQDWELGL